MLQALVQSGNYRCRACIRVHMEMCLLFLPLDHCAGCGSAAPAAAADIRENIMLVLPYTECLHAPLTCC